MRRFPAIACVAAAVALAACDSGATDNPAGVDPGARWHVQLTGTPDLGVDAGVYDLDLFDTPDATRDALAAAGRTWICYVSAGSWEEWRADASAFPAEAIGEPLDGWPGERWLDVRHPAVRAALAARLDVAEARGCDGVDPDNVDGYLHDTGFGLTEADSRAFVTWLADEAHARGLTVGLKNALEIAPGLVDRVDFAVNEECHAYNECGGYDAFRAAGRPVVNLEYAETEAAARALANDVCSGARGLGLTTLVMPPLLDGTFRVACDD